MEKCYIFCWNLVDEAQWIRLHLPSCRPGFESHAHHLCFFNLNCVVLKRRKNKKKRPELAHFLSRRAFFLNKMHTWTLWGLNGPKEASDRFRDMFFYQFKCDIFPTFQLQYYNHFAQRNFAIEFNHVVIIITIVIN